MRSIILVLFVICGLHAATNAQSPANAPKATPEEIRELKAAVAKDLRNTEAHKAYLKAAGADQPEVKQQYDQWIKAHPKMVEIPFSYAEALYSHELPAAKDYLLKTVELDPKNGKAWQMLWIDAERWGDFEGGRSYLKKATEADPSSPDHAFYYASSFEHVDSAKHHDLMLSMPDRFPGSERGAQALYWLAHRSKDPVVKTSVYELARKKFDPAKSSWTAGTMTGYYEFLIERDPVKARSLADDMLKLDSLRDIKGWQQRRQIAAALLEGRKLSASGKYAEALKTLNTAPSLRYSASKTVLLKEKAKAAAAAGQPAAAYDSLLVQYAVEPTDDVYADMLVYAARNGKDNAAIQADVWEKRRSAGKPATAFSLDNYLTSGKTSLPDLKGKVVLVTYWFPGCGPCRGEFPHFEHVVRKFSKDQLAYIGINIVHEQDPYVVPFMQQSGYSFVPVRDEPEKRGNLTARGAPTNYLIDRNGNIIFSNFRTDEHNERTLELMITELLDK
ncbi:TlpA disulfide reductase family protein [Chitinophaga sp. XS-30]|uniref:TlpA disulfide reductase family protein n=1 Tax=Chitinophaga sp. XS-30 TaxID=2604421 RepID=UPI0011DCFDA9|nr:TlpA disulfide reductase family protein [Chitinophaga sp. XS-30]QEH41311.1 TlpA family protein disulfide reductase [Chitinophaga sp. XS-30]